MELVKDKFVQKKIFVFLWIKKIRNINYKILQSLRNNILLRQKIKETIFFIHVGFVILPPSQNITIH
jgi:hypothetical protein